MCARESQYLISRCAQTHQINGTQCVDAQAHDRVGTRHHCCRQDLHAIGLRIDCVRIFSTPSSCERLFPSRVVTCFAGTACVQCARQCALTLTTSARVSLLDLCAVILQCSSCAPSSTRPRLLKHIGRRFNRAARRDRGEHNCRRQAPAPSRRQGVRGSAAAVDDSTAI